ncbi:MAG: hypothetical protein FWF56_02750 [Firmicutes bacterium]|nr:hypothetical protein [Bacillota bacterium]MCL1953137.1 hypothetical protein [Bacillota bacterium]
MHDLQKLRYDTVVNMDCDNIIKTVLDVLKCENKELDFDDLIEIALLQVDDDLFILDFGDGDTGSVYDFVAKLYSVWLKSQKDYTVNKIYYSTNLDLAIALSNSIANTIVVISCNQEIPCVQRMQLSTQSNIQLVYLSGIEQQDVLQQLLQRGLQFLENTQSLAICHLSWLLYVGVQIPKALLWISPNSIDILEAIELLKQLNAPITIFSNIQYDCDLAENIELLYDEYGILASPYCATSYFNLIQHISANQPVNGQNNVLTLLQSPFKHAKQVLDALGHKSTNNAQKDVRQLSNLTALPISQYMQQSLSKSPNPSNVLDINELLSYINKNNIDN